MNKSIGRSMLLVTALTLFQKCFGFLREVVLAHFYGTSVAVDALAMSNSAAEVFMGVVSAFGMVFLPIYSKVAAQEGESAAQRFISQLLSVIGAIGLVIGVGVVLLAEPIVSVVAPGYSGEVYALTVTYLRMTVWGILFWPITTIFSSYLNYREAYLRSAAASMVISPVQMLVIVGSAIAGTEFLGLMSLISYGLCAVVLYGLCRRFGCRFRLQLRPVRHLRPVFVMTLPIFLSSSLSHLNLVVDKIFGSYLPAGRVAALNYGFEMRQILVLLFTTAITSIIYPLLSKAAAQDDKNQLRQITAQGIDLISMLFIPLTVAVFLLARPILALCYGSGAFDETSLQLTTGAMVCYAIGLLGAALREYLTRVYYSIQKTGFMIPVWATTIVVNVTGNFLLVERFGANGLALATSFSVLAAMFVLYLPLRRLLNGLHTKNTCLILLKSGIASCVMGGVVFLSREFILPLMGSGKLSLLLYLLGIASVGAAVYFFLLWLLRVKELQVFAAMFRRSPKE